MEYLFVYGSLRTTEGRPMHNYLRGFCDFIGDAHVGGILVSFDGYSGLQPSGDPEARVRGELYRIHDGVNEELFQGLDHYVGCSEESSEPHEFFRHRQDVTLLSGQQVFEAWVYLSVGGFG